MAAFLLPLMILFLPTSQSEPVKAVSPLQSAVDQLHCATGAEEALLHIQSIQTMPLFPPGLPSESMSNEPPQLQASTLNHMLLVLYTSTKRFPDTKDSVESALLDWNFCSVLDRGTLFDHQHINGTTQRTPTTIHTDHWEGFRRFGLLPDIDDVFNFSSPYTNNTIKPLADKRQQQRYIAHCLPHPDDNHLHRSHGRYNISRVIPAPSNSTQLIPVPWTTECEASTPVLASRKSLPVKSKPETGNTSEVITEKPGEIADKTIATTAAATPKTTQPALAALIPQAAVVESNTQAITSTESPQTTSPAEQEKLFSPAIPTTAEQLPVERAAPVDPAVPVDRAVTTNPVQSAPVVIAGPTNGSAVSSTNISTSAGLSGSISLENRSFETENTSLKLAFSYKPKADSYWFIRSAFNVSSQPEALSYSWGIGYDDWHPGTWAIQLNHWGPLKPGDGLKVKDAVVDLSYKFKSSWLDKYNLSSSMALSKPISDNPSVSWGGSWNPHTHWFIRSTLIKPLGSDGFNWSYGFGYSRYNNRSLSVEYNNWGVNEFPQNNFKKNGQISLIYRWNI